MVEEVIEGEKLTQLSREGYISMFDAYIASGLSQTEAFSRIYDYCEMKGFKHTYSSFESFKVIYYRYLRK